MVIAAVADRQKQKVDGQVKVVGTREETSSTTSIARSIETHCGDASDGRNLRLGNIAWLASGRGWSDAAPAYIPEGLSTSMASIAPVRHGLTTVTLPRRIRPGRAAAVRPVFWRGSRVQQQRCSPSRMFIDELARKDGKDSDRISAATSREKKPADAGRAGFVAEIGGGQHCRHGRRGVAMKPRPSLLRSATVRRGRS